MRQPTDEYFQNKQQQNRIREVILEVLATLPDNEIYYHNLIMVMAELLQRFTEHAFTEDVYTKEVKE